MSSSLDTIEDTFTEDLVSLWTASRPDGLPDGWGIYHMRRTGERLLPYLVIGDEGCPRDSGKPDTGKVALRVMLVSDMDVTDPILHRQIAGAIGDALQTLGIAAREQALQPLARTFIHDILRESPQKGIDERTEHTVTNWTAVVSRYVVA